MAASTHYVRPSWTERQLVNRIARLLVGRLGRSADEIHLLAVTGRSSRQIRLTPVKVLPLDGRRYLVSRRGESDWARNLRAAPEAELRLGSRREPVRAVPVAGEEAAHALREYVRQASLKNTATLLGVGSADAPEADFLLSAEDHPVFRLAPR
jgi:deazaflavin-dependent oxidoreductase (nitroreductase family)